MVNVGAKLLAVLQEQVRHTPSHAVIQSWNQPSEATADPAQEEEDMKEMETDKKVEHCFCTIKPY